MSFLGFFRNINSYKKIILSFLLIAFSIVAVIYFGAFQVKTLSERSSRLLSSQSEVEKISEIGDHAEKAIDWLEQAETPKEIFFTSSEIRAIILIENESLDSLEKDLIVDISEVDSLGDHLKDKHENLEEYLEIADKILNEDQELTLSDEEIERLEEQKEILAEEIKKEGTNIKESTEIIKRVIAINLENENKKIKLYQTGVRLALGTTSILSILFGILIAQSISKRISELQKAVLNVANANLNVKVEEGSPDEVGQLARAFNQMILKLKTSKDIFKKDFDKKAVELESIKSELEKQRLALLNVLEDVSEEKVYKETESLSLLETIGEGIIITDEEGLITYVNPAFEKMLGFNLKDLKGKTFPQAFKASTFKEKPIAPELLADEKAVSSEHEIDRLMIQSKRGVNVAILLGASAIIVEKNYKGVVRVLHDYSEELQLQRQKDEFFSIASHELRTPLTVISGNLDNILQGYGGSKITKKDLGLLNDVIKASDRLIGMVEDFLNVSRLEQGRVEVEIKPVEACKLIEQIRKEMEPLAKEKNLAIEHICNNKEAIVNADESKFREILTNLLGNSLKFTEKGKITISHKVEGDKLITSITDTGIGIKKDRQSLLFKKFQQAMERTLARDVGGTGLGLYISREFARLMGGEMWLVESEVGKGSTFAFSLPLATENQKEVAKTPIKK